MQPKPSTTALFRNLSVIVPVASSGSLLVQVEPWNAIVVVVLLPDVVIPSEEFPSTTDINLSVAGDSTTTELIRGPAVSAGCSRSSCSKRYE
jgi:hypothetical protein